MKLADEPNIHVASILNNACVCSLSPHMRVSVYDNFRSKRCGNISIVDNIIKFNEACSPVHVNKY
jgi:hypothetical protein